MCSQSFSICHSPSKLEIQAANAFSLQRSETFMANESPPKLSRSLGAKPGRAALAKAPTELRTKKGLQGYKHLAPLGEATHNIFFL